MQGHTHTHTHTRVATSISKKIRNAVVKFGTVIASRDREPICGA